MCICLRFEFVLRWPSYYYYYPPCVSAIPGDPRGKTPMHQWQFCGQRLHPQRYCHWNTGCKYMTEGPVVNHSFILPTISHHWNTGCEYMKEGRVVNHSFILPTVSHHWNTGCKYMTEGPVVNHSFILPTVSHHWNTGSQKSKCQPHLYWLID